MGAMTRKCPRGWEAVSSPLSSSPHSALPPHQSPALQGWGASACGLALCFLVAAEVGDVSLGPVLAEAHAVWISPTEASGLPSHP